MERITLSIFILLFSISNVHSQLNNTLPINCSKPKSICGGSICYDQSTQNCIKTETVQCIAKCENSCYNPSTQQCLNRSICSTNERLCLIKYNQYGSLYPYSFYQCYNPLYEACLNNSVCPYPSKICNNQCLSHYQVCVNNTTICDADMLIALNIKPNSMKLCNGRCYDSQNHECKNNLIKCIDSDCAGQCYNSSSYQCLNKTVCKIGNQICYVNSRSSFQCYNPSSEVCLNNSICDYPSRVCNQQCLAYKQICVNNTTICDVPDLFIKYRPDQIKLCNGKCYDSEIQQCINNSIQCIVGICSGQCYNSSQQCLNGTLCNRNEQVCADKYNFNKYKCYNPVTQTCLNNLICDYPSRVCDQKCLQDYEICINNNTICDVQGTYNNSPIHQIKLCNGKCYNSTKQQCIDEYKVRCIKYPDSQECENSSSYKQKSSFALFISILMIIYAILY